MFVFDIRTATGRIEATHDKYQFKDMQVILHSDIGKLGKKYDVVTVSDGYARNYLIPQKLAELATPERVAVIEQSRAARAAEEAEHNEQLLAQLNTLGEDGLVIDAPANDQGHLFAGLHTTEIAEKLSEVTGVAVPPNAIRMDDTLKEVGTHALELRVGDERQTVNVTVVAVSPAQKSS